MLINNKDLSFYFKFTPANFQTQFNIFFYLKDLHRKYHCLKHHTSKCYRNFHFTKKWQACTCYI